MFKFIQRLASREGTGTALTIAAIVITYIIVSYALEALS